jgi:ACR3 family arsenite efflux pump ArsB
MWKILQIINKNLVIVIPLMMVFGFVYGIYNDAAFLKKFIVPLTFLMVYPMMVTLKVKTVFQGGDAKAQLLTQLINFGIIPFITFGIGILFFKNQPFMALGLLLAGLVPTSGMTISWTGFANGNVAAAIKMTVIGLTAGSLATPFYVQYLMGAQIKVSILSVMQQIAIIVFLPMILGFITQRLLIRFFGQSDFQKRIGPRFPGLSTIGVLGIVFVAMALKAKVIAATPQMLLTILAPLAIIYGINYLLSTMVGRQMLSREDGIALVYGTVMRNLSIALAIAINAFGEKGASAALVVAMAYIIQVQSAAWYVKLTDRIFGSPAKSRKDISLRKAKKHSSLINPLSQE